jgi:hypothetical protein
MAREEAALLADKTGLSRYDALMDRFEPGMTSAQVDRVFGDGAAVAARADPACRARRTRDRSSNRWGRSPSTPARAVRQVMRCWASTSTPAGWTSARTRSAAACPRTCA